MNDKGMKTYPSLCEYDVDRILRYAGARDAGGELHALLLDCLAELEGRIFPRVCYREYSICREETAYDLGFARIESRDLDRALEGCDSVIVFAATIGAAVDRLIQRYSRIAPLRALMIDAVCTERIETLCDTFERDMTEGIYHRPRYSPGYGDVPLDVQKDIVRALDTGGQIGVLLGESMLMIPTKSVSAFIGIRRRKK